MLEQSPISFLLFGFGVLLRMGIVVLSCACGQGVFLLVSMVLVRLVIVTDVHLFFQVILAILEIILFGGAVMFRVESSVASGQILEYLP